MEAGFGKSDGAIEEELKCWMGERKTKWKKWRRGEEGC